MGDTKSLRLKWDRFSFTCKTPRFPPACFPLQRLDGDAHKRPQNRMLSSDAFYKFCKKPNNKNCEFIFILLGGGRQDIHPALQGIPTGSGPQQSLHEASAHH